MLTKKQIIKIEQMNKIYVYTDGASRGNPGPAAIGVLICDKDKILLKYKECIGESTNNVAEYKAVIKGLELAGKYCKKELICFSDSEIVVKQLNGKYRVIAEHLVKLYNKVKEIEKAFEKVSYNHVRRTNKYIIIADKLVNEALDEV